MLIDSWLEDYNNFADSLKNLNSLILESNLGSVEKLIVVNFYKDAIIQALHLLDSYLDLQTYSSVPPEAIIHAGLLNGIIDDAQSWENAIKDKDITLNIDDIDKVDEIYTKIRLSYCTILTKLKEQMKRHL